MAKQTTVKVDHKDYKVFEKLAPTEGIRIISATQVGDIVIVEVKYRDPAYLYYLADNVRKTMTSAKPPTTVPTADGPKKDAEKPKSKTK